MVQLLKLLAEYSSAIFLMFFCAPLRQNSSQCCKCRKPAASVNWDTGHFKSGE